MHLLDLRDDVARLMAALDVLVSSSHGEAFTFALGAARPWPAVCSVL